MIPEAAVEAAIAEAESCGHDDIPHYLFRAILEAAAPFIAAKAWDEGHESGYAEGADVDLMVQAADNPYRTTK